MFVVARTRGRPTTQELTTMTKHAGHNRYVSERIAKAKQALGITVTAIHVADSGEVRLSSNWVKVHLDELLVLGEGLADCETRVVAAEEQRTACAETLTVVRAEADAAITKCMTANARADRADETAALANRRAQELASRAEKAERELAGACMEIADLNRHVADLEAYRRASLADGA